MNIDRRSVLGFGTLLALGSAGAARATTYMRPDYYVYFEHTSDVLPPTALRVIDETKPMFDSWAAESKQPARFLLSGSIDGAEAGGHLQDLMARRVEAVRKALVERGVNPAQISTAPRYDGEFAWFRNGEVQPLARAVHIQLP
jgi:hypothetical protein